MSNQPRPPTLYKSGNFSTLQTTKLKSGTLSIEKDNLDTLQISSGEIINNSLLFKNGDVENVLEINGVVIEAHASRHAFDGEDPLIPGADIKELSDFDSFQGMSNNVPRADHVHAHGNRGGGLLHPVATTSTAGFLSAADKLKISSFLPSITNPSNIGIANPGNQQRYARGDHVHAHGNQLGGTLHTVVSQSLNGFMSTSDKIKLDNITPSDANPEDISSEDPSPGSSLLYSRGDHIHEHGELGGGTLHDIVGGEAGFMSTADKILLDSIGPQTEDEPQDILIESTPGVLPTYSRSDHVHSHGLIPGGNFHTESTTVEAGFLSVDNKLKLNKFSLDEPAETFLVSNAQFDISLQAYGFRSLVYSLAIPITSDNLSKIFLNTYYTLITNKNLTFTSGDYTIAREGVYYISFNGCIEPIGGVDPSIPDSLYFAITLNGVIIAKSYKYTYKSSAAINTYNVTAPLTYLTTSDIVGFRVFYESSTVTLNISDSNAGFPSKLPIVIIRKLY